VRSLALSSALDHSILISFSHSSSHTHTHTLPHDVGLQATVQHRQYNCRTGWRRLIGSPKLQIIFHKRATKYKSLLRKITYKDKGSYESSPPCSKVSGLARHKRLTTKSGSCDMQLELRVGFESVTGRVGRESVMSQDAARVKGWSKECNVSRVSLETCSSSQEERWGAGVEYHCQEFNEPYAPS